MGGWLYAISIMGQACSMMIAGAIEASIGSRKTTMLGCILFDICVGVTYWAVNNFYVMLGVYGFLLGFALGIAYSAPISMGIKWMPGKGGLASGIIVAGFGCGALIFNQVQSWIINPLNRSTEVDPTSATAGMFFPMDVCKNVPKVFPILAGVYLVMQIIGLIFIVEPTEDELEALKSKALPITGNLKDKGTGFTPRELKPKVDMTPRGAHVIIADGAIVDHPYKPSESMKTAKFWEIWCTFLLVGLTTTFMSSYWKSFGQSFISDDRFLVIAGSVSSVCNGLFRPMWGSLMDKLTYRRAMPLLCVITAILIGTLSLTSKMNRWFFMIWVCLIYMCIGGYYAMFPAYTSLSFGNLYMVSNYGWIFTNQFISSFISAFFINAFINSLGNLGVTIFLAVMIIFAALLSGFGKKWDYHVGRRHLPIVSPSTPTVTLPANVAKLEPIAEEKKEAAPEEKNEVSVEKKGEETPDEIPIDDAQEKSASQTATEVKSA